MGPHSLLRVRGGQPIGGGPVLNSDDPRDLSEILDDPDFEMSIQNRIIHAGQPPHAENGPNLVLCPLTEKAPRLNELGVNDAILEHPEPEDEELPEVNEPEEPVTHVSTPTPIEKENVFLGAQCEYQMVATDVHKTYHMGKVAVPVLKGVNLGIREGEFLSIVGQSGSGKSTLLHLLGTLDAPDKGTIHFDGQRIDNLSNGQKDILRNRFIGMIFQFYHLLPEFTTLENVLTPLMIRDSAWNYFFRRKKYRERGQAILESVGLSHRLTHKPNELSGGEMQRAAIARALIADPQILLADEPTGNLDAKSAREILQLLSDLNKERNLTIVMVTHDLSIAREADRMITIYDGQILDQV